MLNMSLGHLFTKSSGSHNFIPICLSIRHIQFKSPLNTHVCLQLICSILLSKTQQLPFGSFFNQNNPNLLHEGCVAHQTHLVNAGQQRITECLLPQNIFSHIIQRTTMSYLTPLILKFAIFPTHMGILS